MEIATEIIKERDGKFSPPDMDVPTDGNGYLRVLVQIPDEAHDDPNLTIKWRLYRYDEKLADWVHFRGATWKGAMGSKPGDKIGSALNVRDHPGQKIRVEIESNFKMDIGYKTDQVATPHE